MAFSSSRFQNPFGFSVTRWVRLLLLANVAAAILGLVLSWLGLGGVLVRYFGLVPNEILWRPWTLLSYLFLHGGFWHLAANMVGLFFFGPPLEERWGSAGFIRFYLVAGLGGALLSFLTPNAVIVGASGAVYGILLAYAMTWPDNQIYLYGVLPVKAKWLVTALILFTVFSAFNGGGSGVAHLAHLGGLATAFLYLKSPWAPSAFGTTYGARKKPGLLERLRSARPRVAPRERETRRHVPPRVAPTGDDRVALADVDRILDKITETGIESLTEGERKRLDEVSRRYRTN